MRKKFFKPSQTYGTKHPFVILWERQNKNLQEKYAYLIGKRVVSKTVGKIHAFEGVISRIADGYEHDRVIVKDPSGNEWERNLKELTFV